MDTGEQVQKSSDGFSELRYRRRSVLTLGVLLDGWRLA